MSTYYTEGTQEMKDTDDLPALFAEFKEVRTNVSAAFDAVESAMDSNVSGVDTLDSKITTLGTEMDSAESRLDTTESELDTAESMITTLGTEMDSAESRLDTTESELDTAESMITTLGTEMDSAESRLDTAESELDTVESRVDTLDSKLSVVTEHDLLATAATQTNPLQIADRAASVVTFKAFAQTAAGAGESITVDLQKNGASVLTGVITIDNAAGTAVQSATIKSDGTEDLVADDKLTVVYTYTAGGTPTPMADVCASVWTEF